MSAWTGQRAIAALRWVLVAVVLWQSCRFLRATVAVLQSAAGPVHSTAHIWVRLILAGVEIIAAIMFLAPAVNKAGGYLLLAVFAFAILFHALHGQFDVGFLAVYAATVMVWLARDKNDRGHATSDQRR
ncbi:MAG: hypothetical protein WA192_08810 [Candidatus Acidiferrales bacterium]